jgi:hypothetical protein
VVDHRNFNPIQVKDIFIWCAATDYDIVSKATASYAATYAWQSLNHFADVEVTTRIAPDFFRG